MQRILLNIPGADFGLEGASPTVDRPSARGTEIIVNYKLTTLHRQLKIDA
jgi:hypothetical protein